MIHKILADIKTELARLLETYDLDEAPGIIIEKPKDDAHGDFATNIALRLARPLRKNPQLIAEELAGRLDLGKLCLEKAEAASGFINFFIDRRQLSKIVFQILSEKTAYGNLGIGKGEHINIEFVSANPTGYLHIGHGRGAAYGDSLARIMRKAGYRVSTEHYVNDAGNQIHNLTLSIYERYKELFGLPAQLGEDSYHGPEIIEIAERIKEKKGDHYLSNPYYDDFRAFGLEFLLDGLKKDLREFRVEFDTWFSEQSLYDSGEVEGTLKHLQAKGYTYEKDGAVWLKTTLFGDEKDRVLVKSDGSLTYLAPDIAYHANKLKRRFTQLIDVLGADHHGYVKRLKAAIAFLGGNPDLLDIQILQMVRALRGGEEVKMSKRSGKAITLRDLIDEVGTDALRFMYVEKALNTHMDLDLDLAVKHSNENPVYYVQYAYARIASVFRVSEEQNIPLLDIDEFRTLDFGKVGKLLLLLAEYPLVIEEAAEKRLPHKIPQYLLNLAAALHGYYNDEKIITDDPVATSERLALVKAVQIVIKDGLGLIGVGVKERM
ncbi:MAG: arginine--tRNA ligase [Bacilli bacterium]|nr:arginine--tRNA ligase [Acholeplasmataceae bacterium]